MIDRAWKNGNTDEKLRALNQLAQFDPAKAMDYVQKDDPHGAASNASLRAYIIRGLSRQGRIDEAMPMIEALTSAASRAREYESIYERLATTDPPQARKALAGALLAAGAVDAPVDRVSLMIKAAQ